MLSTCTPVAYGKLLNCNNDLCHICGFQLVALHWNCPLTTPSLAGYYTCFQEVASLLRGAVCLIADACRLQALSIQSSVHGNKRYLSPRDAPFCTVQIPLIRAFCGFARWINVGNRAGSVAGTVVGNERCLRLWPINGTNKPDSIFVARCATIASQHNVRSCCAASIPCSTSRHARKSAAIFCSLSRKIAYFESRWRNGAASHTCLTNGTVRPCSLGELRTNTVRTPYVNCLQSICSATNLPMLQN